MVNKGLSYWHRNLLVIGTLLVLWMLVIFIPVYFALELSKIFIFGWPFSFWMAAIGAPAIFLMMIGWYAWHMNRLDAAQRAQQGPR